MLTLNYSKSSSPGLNVLSCCHVIGWFVIGSVHLCFQRSLSIPHHHFSCQLWCQGRIVEPDKNAHTPTLLPYPNPHLHTHTTFRENSKYTPPRKTHPWQCLPSTSTIGWWHRWLSQPDGGNLYCVNWILGCLLKTFISRTSSCPSNLALSAGSIPRWLLR